MAVKSLNTLIKLHKRRVDIIRREMRALEETRIQLVTTAQTLHAELMNETQIATNDPHMAGFFGPYSQRVRKKLEELALEIIKTDAAIEAKAEAIREEFAEQKKFEIARTNALKRLADKDRARQQIMFDEIGSQQFLKQQEMSKEAPV